MRPQTISEKIQYSTVRLVSSDGGIGTGFFFAFTFAGHEKVIPVIITNKHVVNNNTNEKVQFSLHVKEKGELVDEKIDITFNTKWYFHDTQDLCFCFAGPLLEEIRNKKQKEIFYVPIKEDIIFDNKKLEELSAVEDVFMVGYPIGLWDEKNKLPLFRKGITSSHPASDFNGKNVGVVDMACFPGSSGSPIFILNESSYTSKAGSINLGQRIIFLGILFAGPIFSANGELIIENIPTQQKISSSTPIMINLGYYIKATDLVDFKAKIEKIVKPVTNK